MSAAVSVCTSGIVTGCVPRRAALGLWRMFSGTCCAEDAGCVQRSLFPSLVHGSYTHAVKQSSLVVSSLLPGPWVWGERDSTVESTVTIRVRLR